MTQDEQGMLLLQVLCLGLVSLRERPQALAKVPLEELLSVENIKAFKKFEDFNEIMSPLKHLSCGVITSELEP